MEIKIDIPEEFASEYKDDKFSDSLQRLKNDAHSFAGIYEKELIDMLIKAFKNSKEEDTPKTPTPPHPRWKPDEDENYYILMGSGRASEWIWHADNDDGTCMNRYSIGNVFKSEEDAKFAAQRLKVLAEMREWAGDWNDLYELVYIKSLDAVSFSDVLMFNNSFGEMRFATEKDAENCIQAVGKDRIKKYYFMVPED